MRWFPHVAVLNGIFWNYEITKFKFGTEASAVILEKSFTIITFWVLCSSFLSIWYLIFESISFFFDLICVGTLVYNNEFRMFIEVLILL